MFGIKKKHMAKAKKFMKTKAIPALKKYGTAAVKQSANVTRELEKDNYGFNPNPNFSSSFSSPFAQPKKSKKKNEQLGFY